MDTGNRIMTGNASGASINQTSVPRQPSRVVGQTANYAVSSPARGLSVNQVIRGEVTDLRNREVTVMLDDNTSVTAQLNNGSQLSIGDRVSFRITDIGLGKIYMEAIPKNAEALENTTIRKALEEAGLPQNDKNRLVVRELMDNGMSINKQSIQNLLRQSYQLKDVSIRTLVLMNKHQIPMTEANALQFESYRSSEHQLTGQIAAIADEIPSLLQALSNNPNTNASVPFAEHMLSLLLPSDASPHPLQGANPSLSELSLSPDAKNELAVLLQSTGTPVEELQGIFDGSASLRDTARALEAAMHTAYDIDNENIQALQKQLLSEAESSGKAPDMEAVAKETASLAKTLEQFDTPAVRNIFDQFQALQSSNKELGALLPSQSRQELLEQLKDFPLQPQLREQLSKGDLPIQDLVGAITQAISHTPPGSVKRLLQSPHFEALLREQITNGWTLEPEALKEDQAVQEFYDRMYDQAKKLEDFMNQTIGKSKLGAELSSDSQNMRQNMDFMQTLNQMFSYVQLPLKLQNQMTNADLYVYTRKKNLKDNPSQISVLLHLDMDHLGPLDIHLALEKNQVHSKFYADDAASLKVLKENFSQLEDALVRQGYYIQSEFIPRERDVDIVRDFMERDLPNASLKRYTFDIRA